MSVDFDVNGRLRQQPYWKSAYRQATSGLAYAAGSRVHRLSLVPAVLALVGAAVAIALAPGASELLFWASFPLLLANSVSLTAVLTPETRHGSAYNSYCHFLALCTDVVSIAVIFVAMVIGAKLCAATGVVAFTAYVVVLLCALIRSNAMKKAAHPKWVRVGRLTRLAVALVLLGSVWEPAGVQVAGRFAAAELTAMLVAGCALAITVLRAARVRALLSLRDPARFPAHQQAAANHQGAGTW